MIKIAQLYKERLNEEFLKTWNNPEYIFYSNGWNTILKIPDDDYEQKCFVSVDENDNILGYISYDINDTVRNAYNLGAICFRRPSIKFVRDLKKVIDDIFNVYNLNRLEWFCYEDNPAIKNYRNFIKKYGGREAGYYREYNMTRDGVLRNGVMFEILKKEYKG